MQEKTNKNRDSRSFGEKLSDVTGVPVPDKPSYKYRGKTQRTEYRNNRNTNSAQSNENRFHLRNKREIGEDGVNHINCSNLASTAVGKGLSPGAWANFQHSSIGPFATMQGFLWYVKTEDDVFRKLTASKADNRGRNYGQEQKRKYPFEFFTLVMADAYWQRVIGDQSLVEKIKESTLPFDYYYIDRTGIRIRPTNADASAHIYELIRDALKSNLPYPKFYKLFSANSIYGSNKMDKGENLEDTLIAYKTSVERTVRRYFGDLIVVGSSEKKALDKAEKVALEASAQILDMTNAELNTTNEVTEATETPSGQEESVSETQGSENISQDLQVVQDETEITEMVIEVSEVKADDTLPSESNPMDSSNG